jgi:hypothetical protein
MAKQLDILLIEDNPKHLADAQEETLRVKFIQEEETKRAKIEHGRLKWTNGGFLWMLSASLLLIIGGTCIFTAIYMSYKYSPPPTPHDPSCVESRKIVHDKQDANCGPGQKLVIAGGGLSDTIIECKCD